MGELKSKTGKIFRFFSYLLFLFFSCNCTSQKFVIEDDNVESIGLQVANSNAFIFLNKELKQEFINEINKKEIFNRRKELIFFAKIEINFVDKRTITYEVTNGGNILFDGKKTWILKDNIIAKYWHISEENIFIVPPKKMPSQ